MASSTFYFGPQVFNANGQTSGPIDISEAEAVAVQVTASFSGTFVLEQTVDGSQWQTVPLVNSTAPSAAPATSFTNPGVGAILIGPVYGKTARLRSTAYTSGTARILVAALNQAPPPFSPPPLSAGGNTPADAFANPTNAVPSHDFNMAWNGTTWDRLRTASGAGTGVAGLAVSNGNNPQVSLNAAASVSNGTSIDMGAAKKDHAVDLSGTFVGTVRLQGSMENTLWRDIAVVAANDIAASPTRMLDMTAGGQIYVSAMATPVRYVRAVVTAWTSGTITARIASSS